MNTFFRRLGRPVFAYLLFGLFSLLIAVLTALFLGERLWSLVRPLPAPAAPALRLAAAPEVVLNQGGKNRFQVQIARDHFEGTVTLSSQETPAGVHLREIALSAAETTADVELAADTNAAPAEQEITLVGKADAATAATKLKLRVAVPPPPQLDVVFVLDVTAGMQPPLDGVKDGILALARAWQKDKLDARIALVAFRDRLSTPAEEAEVLSFDQGPFTTDYERFRQALGRLTARGGGDEPDSSLDALALAARLPFRKSASKVLLLITAAPPQVPDKEVHSLAEAANLLRKQEINQLHLIVREQERTLYEMLQAAAPGNYFNLTQVGSTRASFADFLPILGREVAGRALAGQPPPELRPADPPALPVEGLQSRQGAAPSAMDQMLLVICLWLGMMSIGVGLTLITRRRSSPSQPAVLPPKPTSAVPPPMVKTTASAASAGGWQLQLSSSKSLTLTLGTQLTALDLPGLEAGSGAFVAEVIASPFNPSDLGLANRSRQAWTIALANGTQHQVGPGQTVKLSKGTRIHFGRVQGMFAVCG